jgi:hypothetical protein
MTTISIPKEQNAAIKQGEGADSKAPVQRIDVPTPGPGQILVKINWYVVGLRVVHATKRITGPVSVPRTSH